MKLNLRQKAAVTRLARRLRTNSVLWKYCGRHRIDLARLAVSRKLCERSVFELDTPLISVIIPTWRRSDLLSSRALPSAVSQTYENLEILVVSDGQDQDARQAVARFSDARIRYLEVPGNIKRSPDPFVNWLIGPARAMNFGTRLCRGQWIAKLDEDDEWTAHSLSVRLRAALENCWELVTGGSKATEWGHEYDDPPLHMNSGYFADSTGRFGPNRVAGDNVKVGSTNTALYVGYLRFFTWDKDCWRKSHNRNNDLDFLVRLYNLKVRFGYLDETCVIRKPRPGHETLGSSAALNSPNTYRGEADVKRF